MTLLLGVSLALAVMAEAAARVVHHFRPIYEDRTFVYMQHPLFHHWHEPNARGRYRARTGEFVHDVRTNAHGMAGPERTMAKPPGVTRVAMLGDSFVDGFSSGPTHSLPRLLERRFAAAGQPVEVLNFGCASFSPALAYHQLRHLVRLFDPDVVVLAFNLTDVTNDWKYHASAVYDEDGQEVAIDGTAAKSTLYRLAERSAALRTIVQYVKGLLADQRLRDANRAQLTESYVAMFKETYDEQDRAAWDLTHSYLSRIHEWCRSRSIEFLLVGIPAGPQVEPSETPVVSASLMAVSVAGRLTSTHMQEELRAWADARDARYLDLLPDLRAYEAANPSARLYYPLDQHLTAAGNAVAVDAIAAALDESPAHSAAVP